MNVADYGVVAAKNSNVNFKAETMALGSEYGIAHTRSWFRTKKCQLTKGRALAQYWLTRQRKDIGILCVPGSASTSRE